LRKTKVQFTFVLFLTFVRQQQDAVPLENGGLLIRINDSV
jgi:hypothetical protein